LENITTLMVTSLDEDRLELRQRVEEALKHLTRQTLVQKNGDCYVFLTSEEQEVNRYIDKQNVEPAEITAKVSELVFEDIYDEKRFRHPDFKGRYSFGFDQVVDGRPYKTRPVNFLTLEILTPYSEIVVSDHTIRLHSGQSNIAVVALPDDRAFIEEISIALKIEKFIRMDASNPVTKFAQIKVRKREELREHNKRARFYLEESLKNADIYVNGDIVSSSSQDVTTRLRESIGKLVDNVYNKLNYMSTPVTESDVEGVLLDQVSQHTMDGTNYAPNHLALNDMKSYIQSQYMRHMRVSLKALMDRFQSPPYGFLEVDVQWLIAQLFMNGDITMEINKEPVTLMTKTPKEILRFITRKEYINNLMIGYYERADKEQRDAVKIVIKDFFHESPRSDDDEALMARFICLSKKMLQEMDGLNHHYEHDSGYPGKSTLQEIREILKEIMSRSYPKEFFKVVAQYREDFTDLNEELESVMFFFHSDQKLIFDKAVKYLDIFNRSKSLVMNQEIEEIANQMKNIIQMPAPYGNIYRLNQLSTAFSEKYTDILTQDAKSILKNIEDERHRVIEELERQPFKDELIDEVQKRFGQLSNHAKRTNVLSELYSLTIAADKNKVFFLNLIANRRASW
ncbi:MAG TPA: BREX system P-loop protein BrxC, partial [Clostridiaceae bacterium]|nr:BREX system P-loop protein BrxC [Clostridiaceae bacterium]